MDFKTFPQKMVVKPILVMFQVKVVYFGMSSYNQETDFGRTKCV